MAMCGDMGGGLVPYSPQGKRRLARPWGQQSIRSSVDKSRPIFRLTSRRVSRQSRPTRRRSRALASCPGLVPISDQIELIVLTDEVDAEAVMRRFVDESEAGTKVKIASRD